MALIRVTKQSVPLSDRDYLRELIGVEAEELVYLFGCHVKRTFWDNLEAQDSFSIEDRFTNERIAISRDVFSALVTLTLANWLEQRPRAAKEYQYLRKDEFIRSKSYLPAVAFQAFKDAYGLDSI